MKKRTIIIVQARMGSSRLPGKVLKKIMGKPLLEYQIERIKKVTNADDVVIATTTKPCDQPIVALCVELDCLYYRGAEDDVLLRYYEAASKFEAECIVRVNGDCPLIDPKEIERIIEYYHINSDEYDYVSNILGRSYPIGMHVEVFSREVLEVACRNAVDPLEREHVTPYIYRNGDRFNLKSIVLDKDYSEYRWTVDYQKDFDLIKKILEGLYQADPLFSMYDIIEYLNDNPALLGMNSGIQKDQIV